MPENESQLERETASVRETEAQFDGLAYLIDTFYIVKWEQPVKATWSQLFDAANETMSRFHMQDIAASEYLEQLGQIVNKIKVFGMQNGISEQELTLAKLREYQMAEKREADELDKKKRTVIH